MATLKPKTTALIKSSLMAPCGMDCALCAAFLREKNTCPGCSGPDQNKSRSCVVCAIKNCPELAGAKRGFCFKCGSFPCARLRSLDKRYRTKYGMSMLENLEAIRDLGVREFTRREKSRWACPDCGAILCVHRDACVHCGRRR